MKNAKIISSGMYVPDRVLPNSYFNEMLGEDVDTWLRENVHIYERRWCKENESTADLCQGAALEALQNSQLKPEEIDLIIVATDTPEYVSPSTAAVLQDRIGAKNAGTFDLNSACAGFVTATETATHYIRSGSVNNVLVVGAYAMSKYLDQTDKKTVTLFADGAGAMVLTATEEINKGHQAGKLISQGQYADWMGIYGGGTKKPISDEVLQQNNHKLKFVKKFPPELNPQMWSSLALELSDKMNLDIAAVDQFFITQININAIWETLRILEVDMNKAHTIMHHYGYTGSACIPMAFHKAWESRKIKEGDNLFFIGSGGGLAFAANAFIL